MYGRRLGMEGGEGSVAPKSLVDSYDVGWKLGLPVLA